MLNNLKNLGGGAKSTLNKGEKAFTFVEVILVMTLISFLYLVTTKVIQHNLEKKVPLYVYNLYKNLDTEGKLLEKKLIDQANSTEGDAGSSSGSGTSTGNKTIEEVLKGLDAKSYCETFAEDVNLIGESSCEKSSLNQEITTSNNEQTDYACKRTYKFNVNNDGVYSETFSPEYQTTSNNCGDNNVDSSTTEFTCNAQPTIKINNLLKDNTLSPHAYTCSFEKHEKTQEDEVIFDIDKKPQNINDVLKTTNNIHLKFVTLKPASSKYTFKYNLFTNVHQDAICPQISRAEFNTSNILTCNITFSKYNLTGDLYGINSKIEYKREPYSFYCIRISGFLKPTSQVGDGLWIAEAARYGLVKNIPQINENCSGYIKHAEEMSKFKETDFTKYNEKKIWYNNTSGSYCSTYDNQNQTALDYCNADSPASNIALLYINVQLNGGTTILNSDSQSFDHEGYYTKWNNFFNKHYKGIFTTATKEAIDSQETYEGFIEKTIEDTSNTNNYLAHFIYASIDTPFDKGEMNKNIFVFEQFGNKIIPVGYLANNANSPLKFDVITRNPQTFKIEKVNYYNGSEKRPLTFCEAMSYTGEEFSQYCGCKDGSNNVVTQYSTKNEQCNNHFGCIIRPVKPGLSGRF